MCAWVLRSIALACVIGFGLGCAIGCGGSPERGANAESSLKPGEKCAFSGRAALSEDAEDFLAASSRPKRPMDNAIVQEVVRDHFDDFRACYELGLRRDKKIGGRVHMAFVIEPDGSVSNAAPSRRTWTSAQARLTLVEDCEVLRCLVGRFRALRFPPAENGVGIVTVVYPLVFTPQE
jgi:hypothetical protein